MKVALIHNPTAGKGAFPAEHLVNLMRQHGYEAVPLSQEGNLLDQIENEQVEFTVVAGGDGTLRRASLQLINTDVILAPLPLGTANNVGRSLGIAGSPEEIIAGWSPGMTHAIDVGLARGPWGERTFLEGGGIGLVGRAISIIEAIDEASSHTFKDREDKLHRDLSVFIALAHELASVPMQVMLDGHRQNEEFLLVEVLNIGHAGPRIELTQSSDSGDGFFDVVLAPVADREKLLHSLQASLAGHPGKPILESIKARSVRLKLGPGEFRLDDEILLTKADFGAGKPAEIEVELSVLPGALRLIGNPPQ